MTDTVQSDVSPAVLAEATKVKVIVPDGDIGASCGTHLFINGTEFNNIKAFRIGETFDGPNSARVSRLVIDFYGDIIVERGDA